MKNLSAKPSRLGLQTARFILILAVVALFQIAANAQTSAAGIFTMKDGKWQALNIDMP